MSRAKLYGCGTNAGYQYHLLKGTEICDPCRAAHTEYSRTWRRERRRPPGTLSQILVDWVMTHQPVSSPVLLDLIQGRHPHVSRKSLQRTIGRMEQAGVLDRDAQGRLRLGIPQELIDLDRVHGVTSRAVSR